MRSGIIYIIVILMVLSCTCSHNKHRINSALCAKFSLQLQHTMDSLMNYVDSLYSLDMNFCTLMIDSTTSGKTLKFLIGPDPIYRLYKSPQHTSDFNNTVKIHSGVGLIRDSNHIILMDSITFNTLKPHIDDTLYVEYMSFKERYYTDYRPHVWSFELLFDFNGIYSMRELQCELPL